MMQTETFIIAGFLAVILVLVIAIERSRNCAYSEGVYCDLLRPAGLRR